MREIEIMFLVGYNLMEAVGQFKYLYRVLENSAVTSHHSTLTWGYKVIVGGALGRS